MRERKISETIPDRLADKLVQLGRDLSAARRVRKISQQNMADRMNVGRRTVIRMEAGDSRVSMAAFASATWVMGLEGNLLDALSPENDPIQQREARLNIPSRVNGPRVKSEDQFDASDVPSPITADDDGLDF